ncbi:SDR family oxidoreductase [Pseudonocardia humida]|uniref:NmrA family NAD(P)-binding protein n=1 Tax=Pseudonocardia humida TaxID=2800819 RepID=A0ABT1A370_9PSEU|nr:NmrA family NAD(P)-binding protein [Pseudonocardia humida]MCO1657299.1 NmrA family NAD(P)-binding protein [Pseudonocardia humida]
MTAETTTTSRSTLPITAPTLVTGGTGKTGRRVAAGLAARGLPVRIGSRSAEVPFDWDDPTTWRAALRGTRAAYLAFVPDLAVEGSTDAIRALSAIAFEEGVQRLVLLSGRGEPAAQRSEEVVLGSGIPATVVRASWFAQNFSEGYLLDGVLSGVVALPADAVREPFVDVDDLAELAVAALTEDGHAGRVYEATGPELLTFADAVAEIAAATGREIAYQPLPMSVWTAEMARHGVPDDVLDLLRFLFTEVLDGRNESTADGVAQGLGRPARPFRWFARRAAAAGAWSAS